MSRVAWLNRTTILFAGTEKWSLDPRVILMENTAVTEYSIQIQNVDVHDEGPYVCSILTNKKPQSTKVHLIVQGKMCFLLPVLSAAAFSCNKGVKQDELLCAGFLSGVHVYVHSKKKHFIVSIRRMFFSFLPWERHCRAFTKQIHLIFTKSSTLYSLS